MLLLEGQELWVPLQEMHLQQQACSSVQQVAFSDSVVCHSFARVHQAARWTGPEGLRCFASSTTSWDACNLLTVTKCT